MKNSISNSDKNYIMHTALLECSLAENIAIDELRIATGKSGTWYIVSKDKNLNGKPTKVYFKKIFA